MNNFKNSSDKAIKTWITSGFLQLSSLLWLRTVKILYKMVDFLYFIEDIPSLVVVSSCKFG